MTEAKCNEAIRLLVPPGKDPPPPLGGKKTYGEVLDKAARKSEQLLMSSVTTLMLCCCKMLTTSYPVQVYSLILMELLRKFSIDTCVSPFFGLLVALYTSYILFLVFNTFSLKKKKKIPSIEEQKFTQSTFEYINRYLSLNII